MSLDRAAALQELADTLQGGLSRGESVLALHGHDESVQAASLPDAVYVPMRAEDAAKAVALCAKHALPVVPFGVGSGQEGGTVATQGGLSIDTSGLNQILEINEADRDCLVEAGVTRLQLDAALRGTGLFFPVDPGADASLGGMVATGAAGTLTPLYGAMRDNVLGLEVVTADGQLMEIGSRARKSSAGYNLTQLFVASEGTLGLITKVRLKLHPQPETRTALSAEFADLASAVEAVTSLSMAGLPLARAELMDAVLMRGVALMKGEPDRGRHLVCVEFHGAQSAVDANITLASEICSEAGGNAIQTATRTEDLSAIWETRHKAAEAERHLKPGAAVVVTDVCVPVSALPEIIAEARDELTRLNLTAPLSGHLGDGNFHYALLLDPDDPGDFARAETFKTWLAQKAVDLKGTISGEHGIGMGKRSLMVGAHGPALGLMQAIKASLDPQGIFNPQKVLPP